MPTDMEYSLATTSRSWATLPSRDKLDYVIAKEQRRDPKEIKVGEGGGLTVSAV